MDNVALWVRLHRLVTHCVVEVMVCDLLSFREMSVGGRNLRPPSGGRGQQTPARRGGYWPSAGEHGLRSPSRGGGRDSSGSER